MNRFNLKYINELLSGNLSLEGYSHILSVLGYYTKLNRWPVSIVSLKSNFENKWEQEDFKELTQQYFEWLLVKNKLTYIYKVPENYKVYYFLQLLISFISDKTTELQNSTGVSFSRIKKLSLEVLENGFLKADYKGKVFWFKSYNTEMAHFSLSDFELGIRNIPSTPINEKTKHLKPHVEKCIKSIFDVYEFPIEEVPLIKAVFKLFDQTQFHKSAFIIQSTEFQNEFTTVNDFGSILKVITLNLSKTDAQIFISYLFSNEEPSMDLLAVRLKIPKSTVHAKITSFKNKIVSSYAPVNESDGEKFMKELYEALDKIANN